MAAKLNLAIIFIRDSRGRFFVHQRMASKRLYPNRYGLGAGGHIEDGEDPDAAARRELLEETGLTVPVEKLFTDEIQTDELNETAHTYIAYTDEDIPTDKKEWQWSGWMEKMEVDQLLTENKLCPDTALLYEKYSASAQ